MCNHYRNDIRKAGREMELYGYEEFSETRIEIRFADLAQDMFPDRLGLVARLDEKGVLTPDLMRWGFPPVERDLITNVRNTRSASGALSRFWGPWLGAEHRCLVPMTSFSEWSPGPPKGERWFEPVDTPLLCFAGIWRPWTGTRGTKAKPIDGDHKVFAFLTTAPNALVAPIHPKAMPVLLAREDWDLWLTGSVEEALGLQRPAPETILRLVS